uniref:Uncharacterized protein n=1 Tax=Bradyrhizobium ottawaense TaxID=931866 RepID=A0A2U8P221_9BRAD|nr:hypothetical protein CIT37_05730 [Bradyrhizobium ottawaense]
MEIGARLLPAPGGSRAAKNSALRRNVRFPRGLVVRWADRDSRAFRFSVLGGSYDVAQRNFRKANNQLFETSNLLLAVLQFELFVRHHRYFMAISVVVMIHIEPFPSK